MKKEGSLREKDRMDILALRALQPAGFTCDE